MIRKYGLLIVVSLLAVLACPPALASEIGEYELVATWGSLGADDGRFNYPTGIAVDAEGNVYVVDTRNDRIQKFGNTGAFLLKWGTRGSGDGEFYSPQNIALDLDGDVYVVDSSRIQVFDGSGTFIKKWGSYGSGEEQLQYPQSIAFDAAGNAYVVAGDRIKKFENNGNFLTAWGGFGTYDGEFHNAVDVAVDAASNVYVVDRSNNRIQKFSSTGAFLLKWGVSYPSGITVDSAGDVFVTGPGSNSAVQKFDSSGNLLARAIGRSGGDIAVGADGTVYVADSYNHCIRVFQQTSAPTPTPTQTPPIPIAPAIVSNKDTIIRGNSFIVTITGDSSKDYHLFVEEIDGLSPEEYPVVAPGQPSVVSAYSSTNVTIRTTTAGARSIQFNTNRSTDVRVFTIHVEDPTDPITYYDDVKVEIEEGVITINTPSPLSCYLGDEVWLQGTNTDSDTTYLFMTGPDLAAGGVKLSDIQVAVEDGNPGTFTNADGEPVYSGDSRWFYGWNTSNVGQALNPGNYTIYAAAEPRSRDNLSGVKHATIHILIKLPSVTVTTHSNTVAQGDEFWISGNTEGSPDSVRIWIIGPGYLSLGVPIVLRDDYHSTNRFEYHLTGAETSNLTAGQYFVVIQHPVANGFGVTANGTTISGPGVAPTDFAGLQPLDAANALTDALESPYVDDTYAKFTFTVGAPMIRIDPIERADIIDWLFYWLVIDRMSDQAWIYGEIFTITGTTCYPTETTLTYTISSLESGADILSGDIAVADGGRWSFDVNTTTIGLGQHIVRVMSLDDQSSASASFTIHDGVVNPVLPAGAIYRVECIDVSSPLDDLASGDWVSLIGIVDAPRDGCREDLGFSTDLLNPAWSYAIEVEREVIRSGSQNALSFTLSAFELDYGDQDVRVLLRLSGTVPETGAEDPALFRVFQRDAGGETVAESEYRLAFTPIGDDPTPPFDDALTLHPGWNFISIPRHLEAGNDTASIFTPIDTAGHSALRYDTAGRAWISLTPTDRLTPLEGIWIYSENLATIPLTFSTDLLLPPPERSLAQGWNAVGITGTVPAMAKDAFYSVKGQWSTLIGLDAGEQAFEVGIVNGGSGANADTRSVYPGRGYWLYMTEPGDLCAIGV